MNYTTITIKTEKKLRNEAKKTAKRLGIPLSTAMNAMLRQFVREQEIVLSAKRPNAETQKVLRDIREGKGLETYGSFEEWRNTMRA